MMNGGEFIKKVRKHARKRRIPAKVEPKRGKGSHVTFILRKQIHHCERQEKGNRGRFVEQDVGAIGAQER